MGDSADPRQTLVVDAGKVFPDGTSIDASFELPGDPPGVVVLFGPSGAGKTTVLRLIAGLETLSRGTIRYGDQVWSGTGGGRPTSPQERRIGYLVQDYALFPHLSVRANIAYGLGRLSSSEREKRTREISERLGVERLGDRRPGELSGGEQQRVAMARALVRRPRFVMLDEPFAALDAQTREDIRGWIGHLFATVQIPAIVVTHDWVDALNLGDTMVVLDAGRVRQRGTPQEVLTRPADAEVARIAGVDTVAPCRVEQRIDGAITLRSGGALVTALDPGGGGDSFWLCIRGEDVALERRPAGRSSARNRLDGKVVEMHPRGALVKVVVDAGFRLSALVTRQAAVDLDLGVGVPVSAVFKASVVHLVPRDRVA